MAEEREQTYEEAAIIVPGKFLREVVAPALKEMGCEFYGYHYGNGTFKFSKVESEGEPLPVSWLKSILEDLEEDPYARTWKLDFTGQSHGEATIAEDNGKFAQEEKGDEDKDVSHAFAHFTPARPSRLSRGGFQPIGPFGDPVDIIVDMPRTYDFSVVTGLEGDQAFVKFTSGMRTVVVKFDARRALEVAMSLSGLVHIAAMNAGKEWAADVLQNPEKWEEMLHVLPAALRALSEMPGKSGEGAKKLLKRLEVIERFSGKMQREGKEAQDQQPKERPAQSESQICPGCGRRGRPTGRVLDGKKIFGCDNPQCDITEFWSTGIRTRRPFNEDGTVKGDDAGRDKQADEKG